MVQWLAARHSSLFTTAVTQAEILFGLELLPKGKRRTTMESVIKATIEEDLAGRILPFDEDAVREYALIVSSRRKLGRPISQLDGRIAAIARSRGAALATRNTGDFALCGIRLLDPWKP